MKKTYNKLSTDLFLVETEGFIAASVEACKITTEEWHDATFDNGETTFEIGFGGGQTFSE